jgi:threonine synthase
MRQPGFALLCVECGARAEPTRLRCACRGTLDVVLEGDAGRERSTDIFDRRLASRDLLDRSGVWRFRDLLPPFAPEEIVSKPEGNTPLYASPRLAAYTGLDRVLLKHEGENPTGSFKDRGMTVAVSMARRLGARRVACASTGNTAASMASYAAQAGMEAWVFLPAGKVAAGKLAQALAYGARALEIEGGFDAAMRLVEAASARAGIYLLNSLNPFRIEGQKTILFELLQDLSWEAPDWIVLPGGNLGNSAALGKAAEELLALELLPRRPRLAVIQAEGANPFYRAFHAGGKLVPLARPETVASAIRIGDPVSWRKSLRGVRASGGLVEQVSDQEILAAKAAVDRAGVGAEPASCATVAGIKKLVKQGRIGRAERVVGILTGHLLKDPESALKAAPSALRRCPAELDAVLRAIDG